MIKPTVSIIIPIYNKEKYLNNCISSIKNQSLKDIEVICISKEQNKHLANNIMRLIQENDTNKLNITVKFQKK